MDLVDGWYLMSALDLERELIRYREPDRNVQPTNAQRLSIAEALRYRGQGNLPDELDRSLRLVLNITSSQELDMLESRRAEWEPDFLDAPTWRREGSRPVNVVPLRASGIGGTKPAEWWSDPDIAELEREWAATGQVEGLQIAADYRGFVFKSILSLRAAGRPVTTRTIRDSIARWLSPEQADEVARSLSD